MEAANNFKQAELYYVSGNDWKTAVNMYRKADMWEEAYRVKYLDSKLVIKSYNTPILKDCESEWWTCSGKTSCLFMG
jgi:hypothetical protein